jgi:hypothetical protein
MVLNAKVGVFICGIAGSAGIALMQPSDQPAAQAALAADLTTMSRDVSSEEFQKGMTQARVAAERPFATLAPTVRQ